MLSKRFLARTAQADSILTPRSAGGCCWIPDRANMLAPNSGSFTGPEQTKDGWHLEAHPKSIAFPQVLPKQCDPCVVRTVSEVLEEMQ